MTSKSDQPKDEPAIEPKAVEAADANALSVDDLDQVEGSGVYPTPYTFGINTGKGG